MKIAIIADIHGNIHALEAVLEDVEKHAVDKIVVNGDIVNRGPNSRAVMEKLWGGDYTFTLGNHDDLVQMWQARDKKIPRSWFTDPFWLATAFVAEELEATGWIEKLRELKMVHKVQIPGTPVLLISHGSPRHYREGYAIYTPDEVMNEITDEYAADIFIGSHTHRPLERKINGRKFLNTGAVGAPFNRDPRAQYLLMILHKNKWHADFRCVQYDRKAAIDAYEQGGFLANGKLSAHIFRDELIYARPLFDPFWRWTEKFSKPRNWESWATFREQFPEKFTECNENTR